VQTVDPSDPTGQRVIWTPANQAAGKETPASLDFQTRKSVMKAFTVGAPAQNITSINTLRSHLELLDKAAKALGNGDIQLFNSWSQRWAKETGNPAPVAFESMRNAVLNELSRTLSGRGSTIQEIAALSKDISEAESPQQLQTAIATFDSQMESRLDALRQQYKAGSEGKPAFQDKPANAEKPKGKKSLKAAMAMPEMKGKTKEEVEGLLKKHGYEVVP
jgi:hypothetical protein